MKIRVASIGFFLLAALTFGGRTAAAECISAQTQSPIVTPDGARHEAGTIKACLFTRFSPTAGVHTLSLNGDRLGNFMTRIESLRSSGDSSFVQFRRLEGGELLFEGFALRSRDGLQGFRMQLRLEGQRPYYPSLDPDEHSDPDTLLRVREGG